MTSDDLRMWKAEMESSLFNIVVSKNVLVHTAIMFTADFNQLQLSSLFIVEIYLTTEKAICV